jgi:spore maturation protein CgeB
MSYRILYLGNDWYGSCARACGFALRRLGHEVLDVSSDSWEPHGKRKITKIGLRLIRPLLRRDFNLSVLDAAKSLKPDLLIAFKGVMVQAATIRALREQGIRCYQYYPDNSVFAHAHFDPRTLEEYDCCFFTKKFSIGDANAQLALRDARYLAHGYDPELHRPLSLSAEDELCYGSEVGVLAVHTARKEAFLHQLLQLKSDLPLKIWGAGWDLRCRSQLVRRFVEGRPLIGQSYAKAICAAKVNLALLSERATGSSEDDQTTTRSFEIPACGGFMLHPRTSDILELYQEGTEIECFASTADALEKIEYYLNRPSERERIASRGHERAVPAYSYDRRMREIIAYHDHKSDISASSRLAGVAAL